MSAVRPGESFRTVTDSPVIINPGSGPIDGADVEHAQRNIQQYVIDVQALGHIVELPVQVPVADDGRYAYKLVVDGKEHDVEMPGWPLEQVRWLDQDSGNIWDFPRLYVDGSSWVWKYAIKQFGREA